MNYEDNKVYVDEMFAELIPFFLQNRRNEVIEIKDMLAQKDFNSLARMGHKLYGSSKTYGFNKLGDYARELETAAKDSDEKSIKRIIENIRVHIDSVNIVFVSALDQSSEAAQ